MAYRSNLKQVQRALNNARDTALEKIGILVRNEAQLRSPVQTGKLRDSNDYRVENDSVIIGNSAEHSIWIHEGSSRNPRPQRFLEDAAMQNKEKINQIINQEYKSKMRG